MSNLKILLVEDESPKRRHVERFLQRWSATISLEVAMSVNSALDALELSSPDLLLLDMSLPTFDISKDEAGGRPQGFGGVEILRHMTLAGIRCPTIVITGYEAFPTGAGKNVELSELKENLGKEFPELFLGVLHFNSTYEEWKIGLERTLVGLGLTHGE
jgi:CheY-like chemotaxis protein